MRPGIEKNGCVLQKTMCLDLAHRDPGHRLARFVERWSRYARCKCKRARAGAPNPASGDALAAGCNRDEMR